MTALILFLDDEDGRHEEFARLARGDVRIERARTAAEAIDLLGRVSFTQVFLDHDLADGEPGAIEDARWGPTGMTVVDFIVSMEQPPQDVVVHSMNAAASLEMARRLNGCGRIRTVRVMPFHQLITRMQ